MNTQTLRYYERRGLLAEPDRSLGGHRLYPEQALTVLRVIKAAQRLGFTLDEVADLLDVTRFGRRRHAHTGLQARTAAKLAQVDAKLAELTAVRETLPRRSRPDATICSPAVKALAAQCPSPTSTVAAQPWEATVAADEPHHFQALVGVDRVGCIGLPRRLSSAGPARGRRSRRGITSVSLSWLQPLGFVLLAIGASGLIWSGSRGKKCIGGTDPASALIGLLLNSLFGWSWADPIAALVIAAIAVREGLNAWKGDTCCLAPTAAPGTTATAATDHPEAGERACHATNAARSPSPLQAGDGCREVRPRR